VGLVTELPNKSLQPPPPLRGGSLAALGAAEPGVEQMCSLCRCRQPRRLW
jgi:hypothetical protein